MNREFMELYNRELALFYEHAEEFAEEYPGVAERLGAMTQDNPDPMIGALLEGSAFLATRLPAIRSIGHCCALDPACASPGATP